MVPGPYVVVTGSPLRRNGRIGGGRGSKQSLGSAYPFCLDAHAGGSSDRNVGAAAVALSAPPPPSANPTPMGDRLRLRQLIGPGRCYRGFVTAKK